MSNKFREEDLSKITPISIDGRDSKVCVDQLVDPDGLRFVDDITTIFPNILKGRAIKEVASALRVARDERREIVWLVGAHVIKCGLSLYINSLIERGFITALATTGSATIHDLELAFFGKTSEDVGVELPKGRFGMARETADLFHRSCELADSRGIGLGGGVGALVDAEAPPHARCSVFGGAHRHGVPATVHVALGTDITHQHPDFPAARVGELSMRDFRILSDRVGRMFDRGVVVIFGSAVVLPEVFLKAVSIGYNLGRAPQGVTAIGFDMLQHYRVQENVLRRPFEDEGRSYTLTGHHEIMLPILYRILARD